MTESTALIKYETACQAVAEAKTVDEVREIRDKAEAMRAYARQAKNKELEIGAAEIRIRAERRLGQMIAEQKATIGLSSGGRPAKTSSSTEQVSTPATPTLADIGIDRKLSSRAQKLAAVPTAQFEGMVGQWRERVEQVTERVTTNLVKAGEREQGRPRRAAGEEVPEEFPDASDRYRLICGDLVDAEIPPESIDVILTDPPYAAESLDLYNLLAMAGSIWLKPGGSLLAMAGQSYLPKVMERLTGEPGLNYQWTLAYLTPGGQSPQIFPRRVNTFWKPVIWLVKGQSDGEWVGDVTRSDTNDNDKRFHDWGQSESGVGDLMRRFTKIGDVVCDPLMGGGTTGVVALPMNRFFIGIEKDGKAFAIAKRRISTSIQESRVERLHTSALRGVSLLPALR